MIRKTLAGIPTNRQLKRLHPHFRPAQPSTQFFLFRLAFCHQLPRTVSPRPDSLPPPCELEHPRVTQDSLQTNGRESHHHHSRVSKKGGPPHRELFDLIENFWRFLHSDRDGTRKKFAFGVHASIPQGDRVEADITKP
jgi:hypothetical protein